MFMFNEFRVIIAGSRDFEDYDLLKEKCNYYLKNKLEDPSCSVIIISGHAKGADSLGERYAKELGLRCEVFPAMWDKYGKSAGFIRNSQMADIGNSLIAFPSAYSKNIGTRMMISIARKKGIPTRVVEDEG